MKLPRICARCTVTLTYIRVSSNTWVTYLLVQDKCEIITAGKTQNIYSINTVLLFNFPALISVKSFLINWNITFVYITIANCSALKTDVTWWWFAFAVKTYFKMFLSSCSLWDKIIYTSFCSQCPVYIGVNMYLIWDSAGNVKLLMVTNDKCLVHGTSPRLVDIFNARQNVSATTRRSALCTHATTSRHCWLVSCGSWLTTQWLTERVTTWLTLTMTYRWPSR